MEERKFFIQQITREMLQIHNIISEQDITIILSFVNNLNQKYKNRIGQFEYVNGGQFGVIFHYKNFAIKLFLCPDSSQSQDVKYLSKLHHLISYPDLYISCRYFIVTEFVKGKTLYYCSDELLENVKDSCLNTFYNDLKETLKLKIHPEDTHDFNIMLSEDGVLKIVDVGAFYSVVNSKEIDYDNIHEYIDSRCIDYTSKKHFDKIAKIIEQKHRVA